MSKAIVLYLHVHQPYRVKHYTAFDAGVDHTYINAGYGSRENNEQIVKKVAEKSYLPMNKLLISLVKEHPAFKLSLSITGTVLEQLEQWAPEAFDSFIELVKTGRVEIVGETYYHSLAFFYDKKEFETQVAMHKNKIEYIFGQSPKVFRNTELAYNNELAAWAEKAGYSGILAEGWDPVLGWRSPNYVYKPVNGERIRLLMKNYKLSDDLAFRFSDRSWNEWPLIAEKYAHWLNADADATNFNLFMDYETFGEHQWEDSGIFDFFKQLPTEWLKEKDTTFLTVSEACKQIDVKDFVDVPQTTTWADTERDLSAWLGNDMQREAVTALYSLQDKVMGSKDPILIDDWRRLQTSDHFYYMCTKWFRDGDIHAYFSPYESPYEAYINFMNVWHDLKYRLVEKGIEV